MPSPVNRPEHGKATLIMNPSITERMGPPSCPEFVTQLCWHERGERNNGKCETCSDCVLREERLSEMHGIIFSELQNYAEAKHGRGTWDAYLERQTSRMASIFPSQEYADSGVDSGHGRLFDDGAIGVGRARRFWTVYCPISLLRMYGHLLKPEWGAIDVINETEGTVHAVVRAEEGPRGQTTEVEDPASKSQRSTSCLQLVPTDVRPSHRDWRGPRAALWRERRRGPNHVHAQGRDWL